MAASCTKADVLKVAVDAGFRPVAVIAIAWMPVGGGLQTSFFGGADLSTAEAAITIGGGKRRHFQ